MTAPSLILIDLALISPLMIAVDSMITGPSTSILPFTAPAIYAEVPVTSPITIVPEPILITLSLSNPPVSRGVFTYISEAVTLPRTDPLI